VRKRDRKALREYVRYVADVACIDGAREATIAVAYSFRRFPPDLQRETIVHELLHVHHDPCWRMVQTDLSEPLGKVGYYIFCDSYRRSMEFMVDAIAKAIAPHLQLIAWP
jgi:hypothetical protein